MLYFGIPLISKAAATDWDAVVSLLNNTLEAIAQQTDSRVHCLIACHDIPEIENDYKAFVTFLPVEAPIPQSVMEMRADKGLKKMQIGVALRRYGGGYLMFLDSDDLVHKDLAAHVLGQAAPYGYIVKHGYEYYSDSRQLTLEKTFDQVCGSCAIFNLDVESLPRSVEDETCFYSKLRSHRAFEEVCAEAGRPLQPIVFPAVIYLRTVGVTISRRFFEATGMRAVKNKVKRYLHKKKLTSTICDSFSLHA